MIIVKSTFRRIECRKWLPPMDSASPSPVITQTMSSGRAILRPVASVGARPWIEWNPYVFM